MCGHWQGQESGRPHGPGGVLYYQGPKARGQTGGMGASLGTGEHGLDPGSWQENVKMWGLFLSVSRLSQACPSLKLGAASPKMLPEIEKGWQERSGSGKGGEREISVEGEEGDWVLWMGRAGTLQKHSVSWALNSSDF